MLLLSTDSVEKNQAFRARSNVDSSFLLVSDRNHTVGDPLGVYVARRSHPRAFSYPDGFMQPAVFAYAGEEEIFRAVQKPGILNLWGAARRPTAKQVLEAIRPRLAT